MNKDEIKADSKIISSREAISRTRSVSATSGPDQETAMVHKESYHRLLPAMSRLKPVEREVLALAVDGEFSYEKIARITRISVANVKVKEVCICECGTAFRVMKNLSIACENCHSQLSNHNDHCQIGMEVKFLSSLVAGALVR